MNLPLVEIINHVSFLLLVVSFAVRQRYWLHGLAAVSTALGVIFMFMQGISSSVWWLSALLVVNIGQFVRYVIERTEVDLTEPQRLLLAKAFPQLRSRPFKRLLSISNQQEFKSGELVLASGASTEGLSLVARGSVRELRSNGHELPIPIGCMWGDCTLIASDDYDGSPARLLAGSEGATVLFWDYKKFNTFLENHPDSAGAVLQGIGSGIVRKHQLLIPNRITAEAQAEVSLSAQERLLHATLAPSLSTAEIARWVSAAEIVKFTNNETIPTTEHLLVLMAGTALVRRADKHGLTLAAVG